MCGINLIVFLTGDLLCCRIIWKVLLLMHLANWETSRSRLKRTWRLSVLSVALETSTLIQYPMVLSHTHCKNTTWQITCSSWCTSSIRMLQNTLDRNHTCGRCFRNAAGSFFLLEIASGNSTRISSAEEYQFSLYSSAGKYSTYELCLGLSSDKKMTYYHYYFVCLFDIYYVSYTTFFYSYFNICLKYNIDCNLMSL